MWSALPQNKIFLNHFQALEIWISMKVIEVKIPLFNTKCRINHKTSKQRNNIPCSLKYKWKQIERYPSYWQIFPRFLVSTTLQNIMINENLASLTSTTTNNIILFEVLLEILMASTGWWFLQSWKSQHIDPCLKQALCPHNTPFPLSLCHGQHKWKLCD
jgi:hypothetical protein